MTFDFSTLSSETYESLRRVWRTLDAEGEPRNDCRPEDRPLKTCFHEAGHAVASFIFFAGRGLQLAFVSKHGGAVIDWPMLTRASLHDLIEAIPRDLQMPMRRDAFLQAKQVAVVSMAGLAAQARYENVTFDYCAERYIGRHKTGHHDFETLSAVRREWGRASGHQGVAAARACALVQIPSVWSAIIVLAGDLKTQGFVGADRIRAICESHIKSEALSWRIGFPKIEKNGNA